MSSVAKEITKNSFTAVKTSKMLINKGMDADIGTGLQLEIYGWNYVLHMKTDKK
jgi:3-hydroxypropionyl-coenzyme A dehydratase